MKVYVASNFEKKEETREIHAKLRELGYEISGDWTNHKPISPYEENPELSAEYSVEDINTVKDCDIFILIADETNSRGKFIEFGAAILSNIKTGKPKIYVVGGFNMNCMFYFHPSVKRLDSIEEIYQKLSNIE